MEMHANFALLVERLNRLEAENIRLNHQVTNLTTQLTSLKNNINPQAKTSRRTMLKRMFAAISAATITGIALNSQTAQAGFDSGQLSTGTAAVGDATNGNVGVIINTANGTPITRPSASNSTSNSSTNVGLLVLDYTSANSEDVRNLSTAIYGVGSVGYGAILKGAISPLRLIPAGSGTGSPGGTHQTGELYVDSGGALYYCSNGGTNTWQQLNNTSSGGVTSLNSLTGGLTIAATGSNNLSVTGTILTINGTDAIPTLNGLTGNLNLVGGAGVTVTANGTTITFTLNNVVTSVNGANGALTLSGTNGVSVTTNGNTISINGTPTSLNGFSGAVNLAAGNGLTLTNNNNTITLAATGGGNPNASQIIFLASPVRVAATTNSGGSLPLLSSSGDANNPGATAQTVQISGSDVPAGAKAIICSLTSVGASTAGNLRLYPGNANAPTVNTLNIPLNSATGRGFNLTTAATVALSTDGKVRVAYNNATAGSTCGFSIDVVAYIM
jgi:hypothetical protein